MSSEMGSGIFKFRMSENDEIIGWMLIVKYAIEYIYMKFTYDICLDFWLDSLSQDSSHDVDQSMTHLNASHDERENDWAMLVL